MIHPNTLTHRFHALQARTGNPRIRVHDLRHTAATLMLIRNVHPKVVSEMLGHANVIITLTIYSHVTKTLQREAADLLEDSISEAMRRQAVDALESTLRVLHTDRWCGLELSSSSHGYRDWSLQAPVPYWLFHWCQCVPTKRKRGTYSLVFVPDFRTFLEYCAEGGIRTHMGLPPPAFEAGASAIPPLRHINHLSRKPVAAIADGPTALAAITHL
jgi:hypothetical protein